MRAMILETPGPLDADPLRPVRRELPEPGPGEIRIRVGACGVCRTDLHLAQGELAPPRLPLIPGHQVVGRVSQAGPDTHRFREGDRVGVSWLHQACGRCSFCAKGRENLCPAARFTGFHVDGGFAEHLTAPEAFCYALPSVFADTEAAPLLCGGILGYRALRLCGAGAGDLLGLVGFGGSAHLALQVAIHRGIRCQVATRSALHREVARELGADRAGALGEARDASWDAAVLFAPAGDRIPEILQKLRPGGTLAVAAVRVGDVAPLRYEDHLFGERVLRTVTAATRKDGEEFLELAGEIPVRCEIRIYGLEDANQALRDLGRSGLRAAAVLTPGAESSDGGRVRGY
jgi:propanol-preferring alcohol dehydrogenase